MTTETTQLEELRKMIAKLKGVRHQTKRALSQTQSAGPMPRKAVEEAAEMEVAINQLSARYNKLYATYASRGVDLSKFPKNADGIKSRRNKLF